jgi:hypothetical protein
MPKAPVVSAVLAVGLGACVALGAFGSAPAFAEEPVNACGCYRDDQGVCKCTRKSKCGCPEECEPMGCEQKRQREADKAAATTMKQIAAREKQKAKAGGSKKASEPTASAKTAKRDKAAERAERAAQEAMKAALRTADQANPTPKPAKKKSDDPLDLP